MEHKLKREKIIRSIKEVSDLIKLIDKFALHVVKIGRGTEYKTLAQYQAKNKLYGLNEEIIIELKETKLEITTRYLEGKPCTYIFNLNSSEIISEFNDAICVTNNSLFKICFDLVFPMFNSFSTMSCRRVQIE